MYDLDQTIRQRRSTRMFLPDPVPPRLVEESLALAAWAPSNSNIQPWQLVFATDAARDRLVSALLTAARGSSPQIPPVPEAFAHLRSQLGARMAGVQGIARDDIENRRAMMLRNWEFYGAPLVGVVCMHHDLGLADSMGVGMFLQTLMLALTARGIGTCTQVAIAGYPEILRKELDIPEELTILCGLAVGYPDPNSPINSLLMPRDEADKHIRFIAE